MRKIILFSALITIVVASPSAFLTSLVSASQSPTPTLVIKTDPDTPVAGQKFLLILQVSWAGAQDLYSMALPTIKPPQDLYPAGLTTSVRVENGVTFRSYSYEMNPQKSGKYSIDPIEVKLVNRATGEEFSLKSETVKLELKEPQSVLKGLLKKPSSLTYSRYFGIILIFVGLGLGIASLIVIRKAGKRDSKSETTTPQKWSKNTGDLNEPTRKGDKL